MDKFGKENVELGKISTQDIPSFPCVKALPVRGGGEVTRGMRMV